MSTGLKTGKREKRLGLSIHDIEFTVFEEEGTKLKRGGRMSFHVRRLMDGSTLKEYDISYPILSLWQMPHIPLAVKAHLIVQENNARHMAMREDMQKLGEVKIGLTTSAVGSTEFSLMLDQRIIRYGQSSGKKGHIQYRDPSTGKSFRIYESKAMAVLDILEAMGTNRAIGGKKKVNFSTVPDELLEGVAFTKMPDVMGFGVPMWCGNPTTVAGDPDSWDRDAKERSMANTMSFLNIIQETIGAE